MNPSASRAGVFTTDSVKWQLRTPNSGNRFLIYFLDISREHASFHVRAPSSKQNVVRMPIHAEDSRSDRFLEELRNPPIVLGIEGADGDGP